MARWLSKVEDTFSIAGRGLVFVPGIIPTGDEKVRVGDPLLLKRPDGKWVDTVISGLELVCPNPRREVCFLLKGLTKDDVPVGTEAWSVDHDPDRSRIVDGVAP
jgi:hypothetical protein